MGLEELENTQKWVGATMKGWNNFHTRNDKDQDSSDEEEVNKGKDMRRQICRRHGKVATRMIACGLFQCET